MWKVIALVAVMWIGFLPSMDRAATAPPDTTEYCHIGKRFVLRYPKTWNFVRSLTSDRVCYAVTPEAGRKTATDIEVGVQVILLPMDEKQFAGLAPATILKRMLPGMRYQEPGLSVVGDVSETKLGRLSAGRVTLKGTLKRKEGPYVIDMYVARDREVLVLAGGQAPEGKYASAKDTLAGILAQSDFGFPFESRRRKPAEEPQEVAARYMNSIVSILGERPGGIQNCGTGFFIHKDGYIATNAHVVCDFENDFSAHAKFTVRFDQTTGKKRLPAKLISHVWVPATSGGYMRWGTDIALLKVEGGDYPTIPLTPLADVRLGDPVVTAGFPLQFDLTTLNMFVATGTLTRFQQRPDGTTEDLFTTAMSESGSSGGPLISCVTGGAIGQSTFSPRLNQKFYGYRGAIPADLLLVHYPLIAELQTTPDRVTDFYDCYELASIFLARGSRFGAQEMARKAVELNPESAEAHSLLSQCLTLPEHPRAQHDAEIATHIDKALALKKDHEATLLLKANQHVTRQEWDKALEAIDRCIKGNPNSASGLLVRAGVCIMMGKLDEAVEAANKGTLIVNDLMPEPHLILGAALYAAQKLDEGKAAYVRASTISPSDTRARMGVGEFFELKKDYEGALAEYRRIDADMPEVPEVMTAVARCCKALKKYDEAIATYEEVLSRCPLVRQNPPAEVYLGLANIYAQQNNTAWAACYFARCLENYGQGSLAVSVHRAAASLLMAKKQSRGVAYSHLRAALVLDEKNAEVKKALEDGKFAPMTHQDVLDMVAGYAYPTAVASQLIAATPLDFTDAKEFGETLARQNRSQDVVDAITRAVEASNKAFPPRRAVVDKPPQNKFDPGDDTPQRTEHPKAVLGKWAGALETAKGAVQYAVDFKPAGRYILTTENKQGRVTRSLGDWSVKEDALVLEPDDGARQFHAIILLDAKTFTIQMPAGKLELKRQ